MAVGLVVVAASRTGGAGARRIHSDDHAPAPLRLVFQHRAQHVPALVQNGLVTGLGILFAGRHRLDLQVFEDDDPVVPGQMVRCLVQEVGAGVGSLGMAAVQPCSGLGAVPGSLLLAREAALQVLEPAFCTAVGIERLDHGTVLTDQQCPILASAHVQGNFSLLVRVDGDCDFALGLDADEPAARTLTDRGIAQLTLNASALAVTNPAQLWQEDAGIALVEFELLGIRVTEAAFAIHSLFSSQ